MKSIVFEYIQGSTPKAQPPLQPSDRRSMGNHRSLHGLRNQLQMQLQSSLGQGAMTGVSRGQQRSAECVELKCAAVKMLIMLCCYTYTGWWFGTWILFSHILGIIIPTDWYFSEGLKPPTRYNDETIWLINIMVCICRYDNTYVSSYENIYTIKIIIDTIICRIYDDIRIWIRNY